MKNKFDSYIFEPNKTKIENQETIREREFLIGFIAMGLAFLFYLIEIESLMILFGLVGFIASIKWRIPKLRKEPVLGIGTENLEVYDDRIKINENVFLFDKVSKIRFLLKSHEGQLINRMHPNYLFSNGKNNVIEIVNNGKKLSFNFCLFNYPHYDKLIKILENSNVEIEDQVV